MHSRTFPGFQIFTLNYKYELEHRFNKGGKFLKKLWCCVGGEYYKIIWFYLTELMRIGHRKEIPAKRFQRFGATKKGYNARKLSC